MVKSETFKENRKTDTSGTTFDQKCIMLEKAVGFWNFCYRLFFCHIEDRLQCGRPLGYKK